MPKPAHLLLLLAAGACVQPREAPDPLEQLPLPATWGAAEAPVEPAPADSWWRGFQDAGLDAAVDEALAANHELAAVTARLAAAMAEAEAASGLELPTVGAGLNLSKSRRNFIGLPIPGASGGVLAVESESHALSLDLSWEADLWGRLEAGGRPPRARARAGEAGGPAPPHLGGGAVGQAWFSLAAAQQRLELATEARLWAEEDRDAIRRRFDRGRAVAAEFHAAEARVARSAEAEQAAADGLGAAARALEQLLGRYPAGTSRAGVLPPLPAAVPAGLPAELIARRPDLRATEARLRAALARADQAEATLYPRLSLTTSVGTSTADLGELLNGDFRVWSLGAGIAAPLFQGGRLRAQLEGAEARAEEASARFLQQALGAYAEVEGALEAEQRLRSRLELAAAASASTDAAAASAERRFATGLVDAGALIDAREAARAQRATVLELRLLLLLNRVDLHLALGGGFASEPR